MSRASRPKNDPDSVDRYEKLLSDWKPGPQAPRTEQPQAPRVPNPTSTKDTASGNAPVPGTILLLSHSALAVYLKYMPDKEYHLALMLAPNGTVKAQGIALEGHQVEELGSIPARFVEELKQTQTWSRDLLVFHCYSYDDVRRLPSGGSDVTPAADSSAPLMNPTSAPEPSPLPGAAGLRRGQQLTIRFGSNTWDAIFWGRDDQACVLAHKTNNEWALMHLDLERFQNDMDVSPDIDPLLIEEIQSALVGK